MGTRTRRANYSCPTGRRADYEDGVKADFIARIRLYVGSKTRRACAPAETRAS